MAKRLRGTHRLCDGDALEIGHRILSVHVDLAASYHDSGPLTIDGPLQAGTGLLSSDDDLGDYGGGFGSDDEDPIEQTRPGQQGPAGLLAELGDSGVRNCPKCRAGVRRAEPICSQCGYRWPMGSPGMPTQEIKVRGLSQRVAVRHVVRVPVIYSSEFLTLDCTARDVSEGGMFISSEILDPVGTVCEITALPDGWPALQFAGDVCHVSTEVVNGRPAGFGIAFTARSGPATEWLTSVSKGKS